MDNRRRRRLFSTAGAKITSTVSVALVLFVLGLLAVMALLTNRVADSVRESVGFDVIMTDSVSPAEIESLRRRIESQPFALSVAVHTADESAVRWREETGEDVVEVLGLNPFAAELEVKVNAPWASADSLSAVIAQYESLPEVDEVTVHTDMIDAVNANIMTVFKILLAIASALLLISFVLINNTIRLSIYARRFTIHTMKLVGSTGSFIRRPFLVSAMWQGLVAGLIATVMLFGLDSGMSRVEAQLDGFVGLADLLAVGVGMVAGGVVICVISALISTNRYLRLSYDEMFR